jgi:alcohol dehydrogenase
MKAAVLKSFGSPLVVEDVPEPTLGTGEVLVDVAAAKVLAYAADVFSGKRQYLLTPPLIPGSGGVGRVAAVGLDAAELELGDWVICDPTVRARDNAISPATMLQGLTAGDPRGLGLQKYLPDGTWAQRVRVPTENAIPIGPIQVSEAKVWATIGSYLVPFGGFDAAQLKAGEIVVLNGATGAFGSAGVAVALALGAASVIATGRNRERLEGLAQSFGSRVRSVAMTGDEEVDRARILAIAPGPIDCVLDLLPPAASAAQVRSALLTVRPFGRVVLMGGVRQDLSLPYAWLMRNCITLRGQFMYARASVGRLLALVRAGVLELDASKIVSFGLEQVNEAVTHAAEHAAPFEATVLVPS